MCSQIRLRIIIVLSSLLPFAILGCSKQMGIVAANSGGDGGLKSISDGGGETTGGTGVGGGTDGGNAGSGDTANGGDSGDGSDDTSSVFNIGFEVTELPAAGAAPSNDLDSYSVNVWKSEAAQCGGKVYFQAETAETGQELWIYDRVSNSSLVRMLLDHYPGEGSTFPSDLHCHQGILFFQGTDGATNKRQLFMSNGLTILPTPAINPNGSHAREMISDGGTMYFVADTSEGTEIHEGKWDPNLTFTKITNFPNDSVEVSGLIVWESRLFFRMSEPAQSPFLYSLTLDGTNTVEKVDDLPLTLRPSANNSTANIIVADADPVDRLSPVLLFKNNLYYSRENGDEFELVRLETSQTTNPPSSSGNVIGGNLFPTQSTPHFLYSVTDDNQVVQIDEDSDSSITATPRDAYVDIRYPVVDRQETDGVVLYYANHPPPGLFFGNPPQRRMSRMDNVGPGAILQPTVGATLGLFHGALDFQIESPKVNALSMIDFQDLVFFTGRCAGNELCAASPDSQTAMADLGGPLDNISSRPAFLISTVEDELTFSAKVDSVTNEFKFHVYRPIE